MVLEHWKLAISFWGFPIKALAAQSGPLLQFLFEPLQQVFSSAVLGTDRSCAWKALEIFDQALQRIPGSSREFEFRANLLLSTHKI